MKTTNQATSGLTISCVLAGCLPLFTLQAFAIEDLKISMQCSNVVLSWPSIEGETYFVQYRPTLSSTNPWQPLASFWPAEPGTNVTVFVHTNIVQNCGCGGSSFAAMSSSQSLALKNVVAPATPGPMIIPADGLGGAVPLALYPPGCDLSGFVIFDPTTGESASGSGYVVRTVSKSGLQLDAPQPMGGGGGSEYNSMPEPETGFYRVVRDGAHLFGLTNGATLSGVVSIPMEAGADAGNLRVISVREDGSPVGNSAASGPFQRGLRVVLDTTVMSNGVHQISGFASWNSGGGEGSGDGIDAESPPITVNIYNEIAFPDWIEHYGELYDAVLITAHLGHPVASWFIDVYGSDAGYIGTFSGSTTDGNIYGWWDLIGPGNVSYADQSYFDFVITSQYANTFTSSTATKRTYRQTDNWTTKGMWVVANQQAFEGYLGHENLDIATDGVLSIAGTLTTRPAHAYGEAFRIGYGGGVPETTRNAQWQSLRDAIFHQESRNMFYLGHGAPDGIGADSANTNRFIPATEIAARLHTIPASQTNRHSYRFVFLYGCETASGTLPESFGVIHRENVPGIDYVNAAQTPAAFVGWNVKQAAGILSSTLQDNVNFIQHFQIQWLFYGRPLKEALDHAKSDYTDVGFINRANLKVFGNWDLTPTSYNR